MLPFLMSGCRHALTIPCSFGTLAAQLLEASKQGLARNRHHGGRDVAQESVVAIHVWLPSKLASIGNSNDVVHVAGRTTVGAAGDDFPPQETAALLKRRKMLCHWPACRRKLKFTMDWCCRQTFDFEGHKLLPNVLIERVLGLQPP